MVPLPGARHPEASGPVEAIAVADGPVYVAGSFWSLGGASRLRIGAVDAVTGLATAWDPGASGTVEALALDGDLVYAGGQFSQIGGGARNYIAALDATTGTATPWNPNADGAVSALAVSGGTVYAGGSFTTIGGQPRRSLAALDAATGTASEWRADAARLLPGPNVAALATHGGVVYVAGVFDSVGVEPRRNAAAVDSATASVMPWDPQPDAAVAALRVVGETVYAGGSFTWIGGESRNSLASLDATNGTARAWDPDVVSGVEAVEPCGTTVYAGGSFGTVGGRLRPRLAGIHDPALVGVPPAVAHSDRLRVWPNPARHLAWVGFSMPREARASVAVFDVMGREVARLAEGVRPAGPQVVVWELAGHDSPSPSPGLYFVRLQLEGTALVRRVVVIK